MPNKLMTVMLYDSVEALRNQPKIPIRDVSAITQTSENFRIYLQNGESIFVPSSTIMHVKFQETLQ